MGTKGFPVGRSVTLHLSGTLLLPNPHTFSRRSYAPRVRYRAIALRVAGYWK